MVELKLESIEEQNMPRDCFISMRVGDTQKLSRLAATRVYRFPQAGDRRYGKIEVFRRIGACSVDIDPANANMREVSVDCQEGGYGCLGLRIAVEGDERARQKTEEPPDGKKVGTKVKAAKEYLSKHGLEVRLSEAMQSVLRDRPDNPTEYLAMRLLGQAPGTGQVKLPPLGSIPQADAVVMPERQLAADVGLELYSPNKQPLPRQLEPLSKAAKVVPVASAPLVKAEAVKTTAVPAEVARPEAPNLDDDPELALAATKIQAIQRGKAVRRQSQEAEAVKAAATSAEAPKPEEEPDPSFASRADLGPVPVVPFKGFVANPDKGGDSSQFVVDRMLSAPDSDPTGGDQISEFVSQRSANESAYNLRKSLSERLSPRKAENASEYVVDRMLSAPGEDEPDPFDPMGLRKGGTSSTTSPLKDLLEQQAEAVKAAATSAEAPKPEAPNPDDDPELALAATKIQAIQRGNAARRQSQEAEAAKSLAVLTDAPKPEVPTPDEAEDPELALAATKIQAIQRGKAVRRQSKEAEAANLVPAPPVAPKADAANRELRLKARNLLATAEKDGSLKQILAGQKQAKPSKEQAVVQGLADAARQCASVPDRLIVAAALASAAAALADSAATPMASGLAEAATAAAKAGSPATEGLVQAATDVAIARMRSRS